MVDANDCEELAPEPPEGSPAGMLPHFDLRPKDQGAQVDRLIDLGAERSTSASPTTHPGGDGGS